MSGFPPPPSCAEFCRREGTGPYVLAEIGVNHGGDLQLHVVGSGASSRADLEPGRPRRADRGHQDPGLADEPPRAAGRAGAMTGQVVPGRLQQLRRSKRLFLCRNRHLFRAAHADLGPRDAAGGQTAQHGSPVEHEGFGREGGPAQGDLGSFGAELRVPAADHANRAHCQPPARGDNGARKVHAQDGGLLRRASNATGRQDPRCKNDSRGHGSS